MVLFLGFWNLALAHTFDFPVTCWNLDDSSAFALNAVAKKPTCFLVFGAAHWRFLEGALLRPLSVIPSITALPHCRGGSNKVSSGSWHTRLADSTDSWHTGRPRRRLTTKTCISSAHAFSACSAPNLDDVPVSDECALDPPPLVPFGPWLPGCQPSSVVYPKRTVRPCAVLAQWRCPFCPFVGHPPGSRPRQALRVQRSVHLQRWHRHQVPPHSPLVRVAPFEVPRQLTNVAKLANDQILWRCPCCTMGFPRLPGLTMVRIRYARRRHARLAHPTVSASTFRIKPLSSPETYAARSIKSRNHIVLRNLLLAKTANSGHSAVRMIDWRWPYPVRCTSYFKIVCLACGLIDLRVPTRSLGSHRFVTSKPTTPPKCVFPPIRTYLARLQRHRFLKRHVVLLAQHPHEVSAASQASLQLLLSFEASLPPEISAWPALPSRGSSASTDAQSVPQ